MLFPVSFLSGGPIRGAIVDMFRLFLGPPQAADRSSWSDRNPTRSRTLLGSCSRAVHVHLYRAASIQQPAHATLACKVVKISKRLYASFAVQSGLPL